MREIRLLKMFTKVGLGFGKIQVSPPPTPHIFLCDEARASTTHNLAVNDDLDLDFGFAWMGCISQSNAINNNNNAINIIKKIIT